MFKKIYTRVRDSFIPHKNNQGQPHVFHHGILIFLGVILASSLIGIFSLTDSENHTRLKAEIYSALLIDLTNESRADQDLPVLVPNDRLAYAAELKAADMSFKGYFAHTSPEGVSPWYWFRQAGYGFLYAGENLAVNFDESRDVSRAWMDSPTHRANILNSEFTEIGIATAPGVYKDRETTFVVQMFGSPIPQVLAQAKTTQTITEQPESIDGSELQTVVLGDTTVVSEVSEGNSSLIIGQNAEALELVASAEPEELVTIESKQSGESITTYTPWFQKVLIGLSRPLGIILITLGSVLGVSLLLSVAYHRRITQHILWVAIIVFIILFCGFIYLSIAHETSPLLQMM